MDSLYIVVPAYNEEENIEKVVKEWYAVLGGGRDKNSKIVIADSGSVDKTHDILMKLKKEYSQLEILSDTGKQHGPKVIALYQHAINHGADYIFQTDSDGQTNPGEFEDFWNLRNQYDCILGHRSVRGDGRFRVFTEHVVCFLIKIYFGVKVPDANAPFRLMKASVIKKYLYKLPSDYNLPNIMLTTYFAYYKEKMIFQEITFKQRQGGVNSINLLKIVKIGWKAMGDFRRLKKEMK